MCSQPAPDHHDERIESPVVSGRSHVRDVEVPQLGEPFVAAGRPVTEPRSPLREKVEPPIDLVELRQVRPCDADTRLDVRRGRPTPEELEPSASREDSRNPPLSGKPTAEVARDRVGHVRFDRPSELREERDVLLVRIARPGADRPAVPSAEPPLASPRNGARSPTPERSAARPERARDEKEPRDAAG